jgi:hypothetical protein
MLLAQQDDEFRAISVVLVRAKHTIDARRRKRVGCVRPAQTGLTEAAGGPASRL